VDVSPKEIRQNTRFGTPFYDDDHPVEPRISIALHKPEVEANRGIDLEMRPGRDVSSAWELLFQGEPILNEWLKTTSTARKSPSGSQPRAHRPKLRRASY